ncbi:hypothetical protein [Salinirussus salinus]|jgi:hypothetical protein|uniref:hypothetical protein n=1 Tax=Salinirussus salinus TaxID=1198300 RepID=UPI00135894F7|nr:hypothetical protein [Salinirussus salinus]
MTSLNRREVLGAAASVGALAVAGCTGSADDPESPGTDDGSGDGDGTGDGDGGGDGSTAIADASVRTVGADCLSGDQRTDIEFNDEAGRVVVTGVIEASTPCHVATLREASYDAGEDRLRVDIGTEDDGSDACVECVGGVNYEASITFTGDVPREASVAHDGQGLASAAHDSASATPPGEEDGTDDGSETDDAGDGRSGSDGGTDDSPPVLEGSSLTVTDVSSGTTDTTADIAFRTEANEVRVRGTVQGDDRCKTAALGDVTYDPEADALAVDVVTVDRPGTEGEACADQVIFIDYEATVDFSGGLPREASVSHDGQGVGAAAHGSASAGDGS